MYRIYYSDSENDYFKCEVEIQDGTETWMEKDRQTAIASVIRGARVLNGTYINSDQIEFLCISPVIVARVTNEEEILLNDIRRGLKVVLNYDDKRIRYNITDEECDYLVARRESPDYWTR